MKSGTSEVTAELWASSLSDQNHAWMVPRVSGSPVTLGELLPSFFPVSLCPVAVYLSGT